ncbi:glycosyl hydrolase family 65 protein [Lacticaseibacillus nasuensis]|uniref:glycosyl hydrolase family 65 protein n=1 Tax=Lacticaseibacillus nasuensis TaxID=944671 RepID=UPI0034E2ACC2
MPDHWTKLSFSLRWHGTVLRVTETAATITVQADHDLTLQVLGRSLSLTANQAQTVTMGKDEEHESL